MVNKRTKVIAESTQTYVCPICRFPDHLYQWMFDFADYVFMVCDKCGEHLEIYAEEEHEV